MVSGELRLLFQAPRLFVCRFLMPPVPKELFLEMCYEAVRSNADWVPPEGKGALYLRPLLMGSGGALGVGPSPEFSFVIFVAPVGAYFAGGGARLRVETSHQRAADLGVGYVKARGKSLGRARQAAGNYASGPERGLEARVWRRGHAFRAEALLSAPEGCQGARRRGIPLRSRGSLAPKSWW